MTNRIRYAFGLFAIILFALATARAQLSSETPPGAQIAPTAPYAIVDQKSDITIQKNGTFEETTTTTFQALTEAGRVALSLQQISFRPTKESVEISEASIINGESVRTIPLTSIRRKEVSDQKIGMQNITQLVIPFEGVAIGTKIRYTYVKKHLKPSIENMAVLDFIYGIAIPESNSSLKIKSVNPIPFASQDPLNQLSITKGTESGFHTLQVQTRRTIHSITEEQLRNQMLDPSLFKKIPRVQVSTLPTWDLIFANYNKSLLPALRAPLPKNVKAFLATLNRKSQREKVSAIRNWLSLNVTYSGRWVLPDSDLVPRPIEQVLSSKVGDCKDFSVVFIKMLREVGVPADFAVVSTAEQGSFASWYQSPIDKTNPLASTYYFNHAIARVEIDGKKIFLDPTINLAQAENSDFHLHLKPSWTVATGEKYQTIGIINSAMSKVETTMTPNLRGFQAQTQATIVGPLAQYIQSIRFGETPEKVGEFLATLAGFPTAEEIKVEVDERAKLNRGAATLTFKVAFLVAKQFQFKPDKSIVFKNPSSLAVLSASGKPNGSFSPSLDFPFEIETTTRFPGQYVAKENESDCLLLGDITKYSRNVINDPNGVRIQERNRVAIEMPADSDDAKKIFSSHVSDLQRCVTSEVTLTPQNKSDKSQVPVETLYNTDPNYIPNIPVSSKQNIELMLEWRRLTYLSDKNPKVAAYKFDLARIIAVLGYYGGYLYSPAFLEKGKEIALEGLKLEPQSVIGWATLGTIEIFGMNTPASMAAFQKGKGIDPTNPEINMLGGEIARRNNRNENARAYFKYVESTAKRPSLKQKAISNQIIVLCDNKETCLAAEPDIERWLQGDLSPWDLHNLANHYATMDQPEKTIEVERKALAKMEFGMAKKVLREALVRRSNYIMATKLTTAEDLNEIEKMLHEAHLLDPGQTDADLQATSVWMYLEKFHNLGDTSAALQVDNHMRKLRTMNYDKARMAKLESMAPTVQMKSRPFTPPPKSESDRTPALADPAYDAAFKKFSANVSAPEGKTYYSNATKELMPPLFKAADICEKKNPSAKRGESNVVISLDKEGKISDWKILSENSYGKCVKEAMAGFQFPSPPSAPFHVWIIH